MKTIRVCSVHKLTKLIGKRRLNKLKTRYCNGKYAGSEIGTRIDLSNDRIIAIWHERRTDKDGPYWRAYCLYAHQLGGDHDEQRIEQIKRLSDLAQPPAQTRTTRPGPKALERTLAQHAPTWFF